MEKKSYPIWDVFQHGKSRLVLKNIHYGEMVLKGGKMGEKRMMERKVATPAFCHNAATTEPPQWYLFHSSLLCVCNEQSSLMYEYGA